MKEKILYLDCSSGISGDMFVGALLDLGADREVLKKALASLPLAGYSIEIREVRKSGIRACDFCVIPDKEHETKDHDMDYLYGRGEPVTHTHHGRESRTLRDVKEIIRAGEMTPAARDLAFRIFDILAQAEAEAHGIPVEEVHFHEVGAVDSIVDIVSAAVCLDNLHPSGVVFSALSEGSGQIRCQHGLIPVPVPAVTAITSRYALTLHQMDIRGELITPTGAAIAAAIQSGEDLPDKFRICAVGLGAGKREYETPGILRAMWCEQAETKSEEPSDSDFRSESDSVLVLETNIDDCSGEALSFSLQKLMEAGALDAFAIPVFMKKNRPAYLIQVIARPEDQTVLESILFQNTTTIGIRSVQMQRSKLARRIVSFDTPWGEARIKCCEYDGRLSCYPENDSVCRLAEQNQLGFPEMYALLQSYAQTHQGGQIPSA